MKLLSLPIVAVLSSVATNWYHFGQDLRRQSQQNVTSNEQNVTSDEASEIGAADAEQLRALLQQQQEQIATLEARLLESEGGAVPAKAAAEASKTGAGDSGAARAPRSASDPFRDLVDAFCRLKGLVQDMGTFAGDALMAYIWPWPLEPVGGKGSGGVLAQVITPEAWQGTQELLATARKFVANTTADVHAQLPHQLREQLHALDDAAREHVKDICLVFTAITESARNIVAAGLGAFLERHPEHKPSLAERDPLLVAGAFLAGDVILTYNLYLCLRLLLGFLAMVFKVPFWCAFKVPCWCARRFRGAREAPREQVETGVSCRSQPSPPSAGGGKQAAAVAATSAGAGAAAPAAATIVVEGEGD